IPQGLVLTATPDAIKRIEVQKKQVEGERAIHEELLVKNIKGLDGITLNVRGKANEKGHLFAGLHREEIAKEIEKQTQLQVDPSFIQLEHPLKEVGEHEITVEWGGKKATFTLVIEKNS
ncbi:MAG: 50S ribosomal L9 C-terminal domain-containing protein, partial [Candidatus Taylorbacteria bacterium]